MGGLATASILAKSGYFVLVLEKGISPGGCASSYSKAGYVFEAGATTVVGLETGLPLQRLEEILGISFPALALETPMQVHGLGATPLTRHQKKSDWIQSCIAQFGRPIRQRLFWNLSFFLSNHLWNLSGRFVHFPPHSILDFWKCFLRMRPLDLFVLPFSFVSLQTVLRFLGLADDTLFIKFLQEQLLITTQSKPNQTPFLASTAGLTYPNLTNYYINRGIIQIPNRLVQFIKSFGGEVLYKEQVLRIEKENEIFQVRTKHSTFTGKQIIANLPIWNLAEVYHGDHSTWLKETSARFEKGIWGAFTMGVAIQLTKEEQKSLNCLHHQIHLAEPLPYGGGTSIFVSISHPEDRERSQNGIQILAISTHIENPESWVRDELYQAKKKEIEQIILKRLEAIFSWFELKKIVFSSSATPVTWKTWTGRKWGRVGGLPSSYFFNPFFYPSAITPISGLYRTGDTVYPGQGIPAVVLGGLHLALRILEKKRG